MVMSSLTSAPSLKFAALSRPAKLLGSPCHIIGGYFPTRLLWASVDQKQMFFLTTIGLGDWIFVFEDLGAC
jgi:hypothetical protein